jgi:stage V sporulation protein B
MGNNNNKYLVQGSILGIASILSRFIGMLYRIPLTRIVGVEGMGTYSATYEWYNLALLLSSYSIPLAVSKLVSAREIKKEYKNSYRIFLSAMGLSASVGAFTSLFVFLSAGLWAKLSNFPSIEAPLRVLAPTIFIFSIMGVLRGLFQGKRTMIPTAISQLLEQIVNAIVSVVAAYLLMKEHNASSEISTYGAIGGTTGTLVGGFFGLLFLLFIYQIYKPVMKKKIRKDKTEYRESYKETTKAIFYTALPIIVSQTAFQLSGIIDTNLWGAISASKGMEDKLKESIWGIYSSHYKVLSTVPVAIATALGAAIVPTLAALHSKGEHEEVKRKVSTSIKFNMLIAFPSAVGMGVLARPIVTLIFGYNYDIELSANLLRIGSIAIVCFALSTMTNGVLQGINQMKLPVKHAFISLIIHIPLLILLLTVLNLGAYGLVIANVLFAVVICVLNWISIAKHLDYKQEVKKTFLLPLFASVLMGVIAYLLYQGVHSVIASNAICVIISIAVAIVVYGIAVILLKTVDEHELLEMPKGAAILRICRKFHIM